MRPDRVVVGTESDAARTVMRALYRPLYLIESPILFTNLETSELIKYASNAFLAVKISYINQMADLCEHVGANVHDVAKGMGLDKRIGNKFLHPGPGYGGSCFPKDTLALARTADQHGAPVTIVDAVVAYNAARKQAMATRVIAALDGGVQGKTVAVLGLAFKPETDDMRDSPALDIIAGLIDAGATIRAYDPKAMDEARPMLPAAVTFCATASACLDKADAAVVVTEWNEFRALTPASFETAMAGNVIVDLRNVYEPEVMRAAGLCYSSIGR
jgi:UDPglucose 6-dehydrogenase